MTDELYAYVLELNRGDDDVASRLREETRRLPEHELQISAEQSAILRFFAAVAATRNAIEVGVFTGYSALAVAAVLPSDGVLVACDVHDGWTSIARRYWKEAGVDGRIDLRIAPATETLEAIRDGRLGGRAVPAPGEYDFAFVDADKETYPEYYELVLDLIRPGGIVVFDNTLRGGIVADPSAQDAGTLAVREVNRRARDDDRVDSMLLAVADGLLVVRKR